MLNVMYRERALGKTGGSKRTNKISLIVGLLFVLAGGVFFALSPYGRIREYFLSHYIVGRVESFRQQQQRLPDSIREIDPSLDTARGPVFYEKLGPDAFIVWYGWGLRTTVVFNSATGEWHTRG
jgi:hypothetical protein